jgi:acyl dehydratase
MSDFPVRGHRLAGLSIAAVSQAQVDAYLLASGDDNPLHSDLELARRAGLVGIPVPGMMVMGLAAQYLAQWPSCQMVIKLSARFVSPVLVGHGLTIEGRIAAVDAKARDAVVRLTASQNGTIAVLAEAKILLSAT